MDMRLDLDVAIKALAEVFAIAAYFGWHFARGSDAIQSACAVSRVQRIMEVC